MNPLLISSLLAFIQALPELLKALPEFLNLLNRVGGIVVRFLNWAKDHELEKWISDLEGSIDKLEKAKTAEEKLAAAKSLADSIRNIK